jgi:predicted P-loop ATPase
MTDQPNNQGDKLTSIDKVVDFLENNSIEAGIRLNVRSGKIEYQNKEISFDSLATWFYKTFGKAASKELLADAIIYFGRKQEYDPFMEHLGSIKQNITAPSIKDSTAFFHQFCHNVLGITNPLYVEYIKCFAIGVIARTYQPGCKHDDALVLQGAQGIGKSTFFRELIGDDFFSDRLQGDLFNKDQTQLMQKYVVLEWSELDQQFRRDRTESIKSGLRSQFDDYRPPYGKDTIRNPRRCIIVGTTNEQNFLGDKTGNRAFHVVPINCTIDIEKVKQLREMFWRCAITLYEAGLPHHLVTEELKALHKEDIGHFEYRDPWYEAVEAYVDGKLENNPQDWFRAQDFLVEYSSNPEKTPTKVLREFEDAKYDRSSLNRLGGILKQLGLVNKTIRAGKEVFKAWSKK